MLSKAYKNEVKETISLAIPIIIAQLGVILMSVSDNIMIGQMLGKEALGAAGLANTLAFLIACLAIGGLPIVAPLISKDLAGKKLTNLKNTYLTSVRMAIWYVVVLSLIGLIIYLNFNLLRQSFEIESLSKPFFFLIILSNIPLIFFIAFKQTTDGLSFPNIAMSITFFGLVLNILFNYLLIPILGLNGAAYSTLSVRLIMCFAIVIYLWKSEKFKPIRTLSIAFKPTTWELMKLSIPGGLQFFFEIGAFAFAVIMMGWISETALAAHQIAISIVAVTYMMASGIGFSGAIRVGNALGLESLKQVKVSANVTFALVTIFMSISMLIMLLFKEPLIKLYIDNSEILAMAKPLLTIAAIFQLSDGIQVVALGNLRGISDLKIPAYITFIAYWIISLPLAYHLGFIEDMGARGIWIALLVGLSLAAVFLTFRFYWLIREKSRIHNPIGHF